MHEVVAAYLDSFAKEADLLDLDEATAFEHFVNYCLAAQLCSEPIDTNLVTTSVADESIDGVLVVLDGELISTEEEAKQFFASRKSQDVAAIVLFSQAKTSEGFNNQEISSLSQGVLRVLDAKTKLADPILLEFRKIRTILSKNLSRLRGGRPAVRLRYVTTGSFREGNGLEKYFQQASDQIAGTDLFSSVSYEPVDRERLISLWNRIHTQEKADIEGRWLSVPTPSGTISYMGIAKADDFVKSVLSDSDGNLRAAVFDQNVRAFLGEDNDVNRRILDTIQNKAIHDQFALLNNGITIVTEKTVLSGDSIHIENFQIVNGCQTSNVLYHSRLLITDMLRVPVRVIQATDRDLVDRIVEATNSQTAINQNQLLSRLPFAQQLERYFMAITDEDRKLYFERRTQQHGDSSSSRNRIISVETIARAFMSMFMDLPNLAARYPNQAIRAKQDDLFLPDHREISYYTAALANYRLGLSLGNSYVDRRFQLTRWHLLMIWRRLVTTELPTLNSKKLDKKCDLMVKELSKPGKQGAALFVKAAKILEDVGVPTTRDQIKSEKFRDALLKRFG